MNNERKSKNVRLDSLFGMDAKQIVTDALFLEEPARETLEDVAKQLNEGVTKVVLWNMCKALQPLLGLYSRVMVRMRSGNKRLFGEADALMKQGTIKSDMSRAVAFFLCEPANLQHYVDMLSEQQCELWRQLLSRIYISEGEAKRILNTSQLIIEEQKRGYYYYAATETLYDQKLMFLSIERSVTTSHSRYGYRSRVRLLTLPAAIYPYFYRVFFPEADMQELGRTQLPSDQYKVCNFEVDSVAKFSLLQGMLKAGKLPLRAKGIGMTDIKRVAKTLALQEVFDSDAVKGSCQEGLRARYYVEMLALSEHIGSSYYKSQLTSYEFTLRKVFYIQFSWYHPYLIGMLLPHIKGLRRNILENNTAARLLQFFMDCFKEEPENWVAVSDVLQSSMMQLSTGDTPVPYAALVFSPEVMNDFCVLTNEFTGKELTIDSFVNEFGLTLLQGFSLLMCSLGMAEVALSPLHRSESPFARVEFVRLTELGRFALNLTQIYEPPQIEQTAYFQLDSERLIIRSLVNPNPYEQLLKDSSKPISKNRYETSASSFLAGCKSRSDVEKNIAIFRQFISDELPPLWKQFFDSLLQHCNPLLKDTTDYYHFRISPDNTDLIRLITTDEKLRKLVIRAEDYRILVKSENLHKFEERLKKHGYLL